jgi:hypothetical protein
VPCRKRIGVVERSGQIDATKPFARTQRLRLVMRLLLELKNRSLVGPEWQLYILSWTAETVAEDLQGLARPSSHFSTADYRAAR